MLLILLCALLLQATNAAPFYAVIISVFGLLVSGGAFTFFMRYGTRLALVEKESKETKEKLEKHATELITANTQVALVAAALEGIKTALNDLKQDVKQWMRDHTAIPSGE
jgi:hypothetical protein